MKSLPPIVEDLENSEESRQRRLDAFVRFTKLQLDSQDIDPAYPVLRHLERELDEEDAIGFSLQYVAFYNLTSALRVWNGENYRGLPTGIERRGLRLAKNMGEHLDELVKNHRIWKSKLQWEFVGEPLLDWTHLRQALETIKFNGRWASYKTAEILQKVHDWPIAAPDMGNEGSTGPVYGLKLFYPEMPLDLLAMDIEARRLRGLVEHRLGRLVGIEQLETLLCDFHSMARGHYYNGHDIDQMLEQSNNPEVPGGVRVALQLARYHSIPHPYLGELHGWFGRRVHLEKVYAMTGEVLCGAAR